MPDKQLLTAAAATAAPLAAVADVPVLPEYLDSIDLEKLTGTPQSTWRYWATQGEGPASFKLGRRRVWKRSDVLAWLEELASA